MLDTVGGDFTSKPHNRIDSERIKHHMSLIHLHAYTETEWLNCFYVIHSFHTTINNIIQHRMSKYTCFFGKSFAK